MHASKFTKFKLIFCDARVFSGIWFDFIYPHNLSLFFATPQIYVAAGKNNAQPCFYQPQHFYLKNTSLEVSARSHVFITDDRNVSEILLRPVCA